MFAFPFEFSRTSDVENLARCYLQSLSGRSSLAQWQGWIGDPDGTIPIVVPVYYFASQYLLSSAWNPRFQNNDLHLNVRPNEGLKALRSNAMIFAIVDA
jgi:hypothetical protein